MLETTERNALLINSQHCMHSILLGMYMQSGILQRFGATSREKKIRDFDIKVVTLRKFSRNAEERKWKIKL